MKNKVTLFIVLAALIFLSVFFGTQITTRQKYEDLRKTTESPVMQLRVIGAEDQTFLNEVTSNWKIRVEECPDQVLVDVFKLTGAESNVQGMVSLYTHDIPPYSFFDKEGNKREAIIAATLSMITPITEDGCVYHKQGVAYIKLNANTLDYFEDTKAGVKHIIYSKPKPAQQDAPLSHSRAVVWIFTPLKP